jgi:hypothetical protein
MTKEEEFENAITTSNIETMKKLLKDPTIHPEMDNNMAVMDAAEHGFFDILSLLLNDSRVNPSDQNNFAIIYANDNSNNQIVEILWRHKAVKESLKNDDNELYEKLTKKDIKDNIFSF